MEENTHSSLVGNNSNLDSSALEKTLKSVMSIISEVTFNLGFLNDWLKDAREGKRLIDRHEALFIATDIAKEAQYQLRKLDLYTIKNENEETIRSSLSHSISNDAIETIIELKKKGKF
jgi:hypothetical protein